MICSLVKTTSPFVSYTSSVIIGARNELALQVELRIPSLPVGNIIHCVLPRKSRNDTPKPC